MAPVNWRRTRVKLPDDLVQTVRFVSDGNRAAVWKEEKDGATRLAYAMPARLELSRNIRKPHIVYTDDGEWEVVKLSNACCGHGGISWIAQRKISMNILLDPSKITLP